MSGTSALLVPVLSVEPIVQPFRRRLDPTCRQGMPAHVTVLVPFVEPRLIDDSVISDLSVLFSTIECFDFVLDRTKWFDQRVLYLEPNPPTSFRQLTDLVVGRFPDHPPYGGQFSDVIAHLTIAEGGRWRKRKWRMRRAEAQLAGSLPLSARASEVWLMTFDDQVQQWSLMTTFSLKVSPQGRDTGLISGTR